MATKAEKEAAEKAKKLAEEEATKKAKEEAKKKADEEKAKAEAEKKKKKAFSTSDRFEAEIVQRAMKVVPLITGNRLILDENEKPTRCYKFEGVSPSAAKKALEEAKKDKDGNIVLP